MSLSSKMASSGYMVFAVAAVGGYLVFNGTIPIFKKAERVAAVKEEGPDLLAAAVTTTRVAPADFVAQVMITGTLVAREEILVGPEVEGLRIVEVLADEGDHVTQGQVLARLVSDTLDAQAAQNDAAQAKASAAIAQAKSTIASAEAKLVEAQNAYDRGKPLQKSGVISDAVQDQRESAAKVAEAARVAALDALKSAEADKKQTEAQRRELDWKRSRTAVMAPQSGVISRRVARVGGFAAGASDAMFRIVARDEIELEAEALDTQIAQIKEGQSVAIVVPGGGEVSGKVRIVSPEIDKTTRLGRVRVFIGSDTNLRIGGFARGSITVGQSRGLSVPVSAVQYGDGGATVQLIRNDRVVTRPVKLGLRSGKAIEVVGGLEEGDTIVAVSGSFLRDGDRVRPIAKPAKLSEAKP